MDGSNILPLLPRRRRNSYMGYSIAASVLWAVLLAIVHMVRREKASRFHTVGSATLEDAFPRLTGRHLHDPEEAAA